MAQATGGDVLEITYNHPIIGTGKLFPKSAEDCTLDPGGIRTTDDKNMADGAGRQIKQMNRVLWSFAGPVSWDANIANELAQLQKLAASPINADYTISWINGTVWGGTGSVVGDLEGNTNAATVDIKLSGGGELSKIVG